MLITSIDVDVGSSELGVINRGRNDANVNMRISEYQIGRIEELALPLFIELFDVFAMPVSFAVRGQLTELDNSILTMILGTSVDHDIGAHGYYHKHFTNLSCCEAENELRLVSIGMNKFGIIPKTFVFPANNVAHLALLKEYGYKCYRGRSGFMNDALSIEKRGELYNITPSLYIDQQTNLTVLKKILDISILKKLPFHIWFHLWNFGETKKSIQRSIDQIFIPLLLYAKQKEKSGVLLLETMLSAAEKFEMTCEHRTVVK